MKTKILILLIFVAPNIFSQNLPINPQTGLVSIKDSISIKNKSLQEINSVFTKWGHTLLDVENLKTIYKLSNAKQIENIAINLPVGSILTQDKGGYKYYTNGVLSYAKAKTSGLNAFAPTVISGGIKFGFYYTINKDKLIFEFTNLEYSPDMVYYGKYEADKPPQNSNNPSFIFKMNKKEWETVKVEYFEKLKILSGNLKVYATNQLLNNVSNINQSLINYDSYKKITTGMTYSEVIKMLNDEGKELSNISSQVGGKTVTQQTIIWHELDNTKSITVTFVDGIVTSKSQNNL